LNADNEIAMLEKMNITAELKSLKGQINPHFLFNALNTVYYKIDKTNSEARHVLQKFSEMLRYQLYDCDRDYTKIESELQFLKSYIELQKSRLNNNYEVLYMGFDNGGNFLIAPFLLMPIIENCFKHVSDFNDRPNRIQIEINMEGSCLKLNTFNTLQIKPDTLPGGIGLENVKKRLDYLYKNKYSMEMKSSELCFETHLKLKLN
jgi:LytS/YehU family sensor histidine kinase